MDNLKLDRYSDRGRRGERYLGVVFTNNLKPASQYQTAYVKANRILGLIYRTISYKSQDILLKLYKTLVRPH